MSDVPHGSTEFEAVCGTCVPDTCEDSPRLSRCPHEHDEQHLQAGEHDCHEPLLLVQCLDSFELRFWLFLISMSMLSLVTRKYQLL